MTAAASIAYALILALAACAGVRGPTIRGAKPSSADGDVAPPTEGMVGTVAPLDGSTALSRASCAGAVDSPTKSGPARHRGDSPLLASVSDGLPVREP